MNAKIPLYLSTSLKWQKRPAERKSKMTAKAKKVRPPSATGLDMPLTCLGLPVVGVPVLGRAAGFTAPY